MEEHKLLGMTEKQVVNEMVQLIHSHITEEMRRRWPGIAMTPGSKQYNAIVAELLAGCKPAEK